MEEYPIKVINGIEFRVKDRGIIKLPGAKKSYHIRNIEKIKTPEEKEQQEREIGELLYRIRIRNSMTNES